MATKYRVSTYSICTGLPAEEKRQQSGLKKGCSPDHYKDLANCIEALLTGQKTLFSADPFIEKHARKAAENIREKHTKEQPADNKAKSENDEHAVFKQVDIASLNATQVRSLGAEYVCQCQWNKLQFNEILIQNGISKHLLPLIEALVVGRLVCPGSELHTWQWAMNYSSICELTGNPLRPSLNSLYRAGDRFFQMKDSLEQALAVQEKNLFSLQERKCFFDLTNTYFEGQANANPKAKRGRSKEKRSNCKLLTLALVKDIVWEKKPQYDELSKFDGCYVLRMMPSHRFWNQKVHPRSFERIGRALSRRTMR